jgi:hypothetical protein
VEDGTIAKVFYPFRRTGMSTTCSPGCAIAGKPRSKGIMGRHSAGSSGPSPARGRANADELLWAALKEGGHVILIRHATTDPGTGDPPGFKLGDCSTQRNLSEAGRIEARRIGDAFAQRSIPVGEVRSSRWCRCLETARIAFGSVQPWAMLDCCSPTPPGRRNGPQP